MLSFDEGVRSERGGSGKRLHFYREEREEVGGIEIRLGV